MGSSKSNLAISVISNSAPVLLILVTTPLYLARLGVNGYGFIAILFLLFDQLGMLDLGLSRSTAFFLCKCRDDDANFARIFSTALISNIVLGLLVGLLMWTAASLYFILDSSANTGLTALIKERSLYILLVTPIIFSGNVFNGRLEASEDLKTLSLIQMLTNVATQLVPLVAIELDGGNSPLASAVDGFIGARILMVIVLIGVSSAASRAKGFIMTFDSQCLKGMLNYGGWITVDNIINPIIAASDRFITASITGAAGIGIYSIAYNIASKVLVLPNAFGRTTFPRLAKLDPGAQRTYLGSAFPAFVWMMSGIVVLGLLAGPPFLQLWLGKKYDPHMATALSILLIGFLFNGLAYCFVALLNANGKVSVVAKTHATEIFPYLGILYYLASHWGIEGAATAWTTRAIIDTALLYYLSDIKYRAWRSLWHPSLALLGSLALVVAELNKNLLSASIGLLICLWCGYRGYIFMPR